MIVGGRQQRKSTNKEGDMRHQRRHFLRQFFLGLAAGAVALPAVSRMAWAQAYPARPVRLVVGLPAGSSPDIGARLMAQWLSERLGQQFVVDNRPGANTNIGTETVVRAPADGYTLLLIIAANAVNATLYENLSFNIVRDLAPVAGIARVPQVMEVHPSVPVTTVPEFIAYAKANPGKLNMASGGVGGTPHVAGELFKMMAGIDMVHVPYRTNPRPDLLGGQVQVMFDTVPASIEYIRAGKLRALAVTSATRLPALPDVPTVAEFLPGYEASGWQGLAAPRGTPTEIVERLNTEINAALADAGIRAQFANLGAVPMPMRPAEFARLIQDEIEKWAKVIKFAGIKAD
jgi:tripartite-type tricarboxylate transporter receptor subunit TctC